MANLDELKNQRKTIKSAITRHENQISSFKDGDNYLMLETRLTNLNELFKSYNSVQTDIENILLSQITSDDNEKAIEEANDKERDKVESQYYNTVGLIQSLLLKYKPESISSSSNSNSSTVINITKNNDTSEKITNLKPLPLPVFSGNHSDWYNFYDSFKSLVDDDSSISDIRKFHYLRSCLKDEALRAIESLSISGANYSSAISLLKKRFENKRLIVDEHIANILNIPVLHKNSYLELRKILDIVQNNLAALKVLDLPVDTWDQILISIIVGKLDFTTRKEWQTILQKDLPTLQSLLDFIEKRCQILESVSTLKPYHSESSNHLKPNQQGHKYNNLNKTSSNSFQSKRIYHNPLSTNAISLQKISCYFCKKAHTIYSCTEFVSKNVTDRIKLVENLKLCVNCLKPNHNVSTCRSNTVCRDCKERHHTLLHINEFVASSSSASCQHVNSLNQVLLSTVSLLVKDNNDHLIKCRALLDQGSQANIVTSSFAKKLNLEPKKLNTTITGINSHSSIISEIVTIKIKSRINNYTQDIKCLIVPKITEPTPSFTFQKSKLIIPQKISLADPEFNITNEIDILLGAELFWNILIDGPKQILKDQPYFQNSQFGWLIGGGALLNFNNSSCNLLSFNNNLETQVENFWKNEEIGETTDTWSLEHSKCEAHFLENTVRDAKGNFIVRLPFKENKQLGNSHEIAIKRHLNLEQKFRQDPQLASDYKGFMAEYLSLQHMVPVPINELDNSNSYYLPHHCVFKNTIGGPKIRVVFDASAASSNGSSLNNNLLTGPTIQEELFSILCRFRTYKYVLSADIAKMYRMIHVHPDDQNYQRVLWRFDTNDSIQTFKLTRVTFGLTCSPFLAVRCLQQLADEVKDTSPIASLVIKRDFYMDDLLTGGNNISDILQLKKDISNILSSGGFHLCKWISNSSDIIKDNQNQSESDVTSFNKNEDCKILGFYWNHTEDYLKYNVNLDLACSSEPITKRKILSSVSKIFDPLGLINPVVVNAKILLQNIWSEKLGWDQSVPTHLKEHWLKYVNDLKELSNIHIPRNVISTQPNSYIELHGFADASIKAYGACLYIKTIDLKGNTSVNLLCAKSRVAPTKTITLPRLELNAAVLLIKLVNKVRDSFDLPLHNRFFWTDSTIVLSWIKQSSNTWKQYVGNRVAIIQNSSEIKEWRHVRSCDNPADIVSRGSTPFNLNISKLWWHGPSWLLSDPSQWPNIDITNINNESEILSEQKQQQTINLINTESEWPILTKFSNFSKLQRVIAYCLRFIKCLKEKVRNAEPLSAKELNNATIVIVKQIQSKAFPVKFSNNKKFHSKKLLNLDPFLDSNNLIRVGGRIKNASITYDQKHPIVLPDKHHVTKLIIEYFHKKEMHAGSQATLAAIRQQFWPIGGRNLVRKIIFSCYKCRRVNPIINSQKMGDLPKERLNPLRPFYVSGVDYGGPFLIKEGHTRNAKKVKAYIALFVCFASKAVHLELVGNLTTESFLAALKRFTARRGYCAELYSDNGTNFVGAERELLKSSDFQAKVGNFLSSKNVNFHFIPARSPHFGGLWERNIRSVKYHLRRVVGDASLTYEEFYTVLTGVEACLNSRPLTPLSNDPNDLDVLTPGHFLIGAPLTSIPEDDLNNVTINRLSRWQRVQQINQHFWQRWQREYLSELQHRPKKQQVQCDNIKIGAMVLLIDDNLPPLKWRLGRIIDIHPGSDNLVRVVSINTATGITKRSIKKICLLSEE